LMAFFKGELPEEYLSHNFDEQCLGGTTLSLSWEDTRLI